VPSNGFVIFINSTRESKQNRQSAPYRIPDEKSDSHPFRYESLEFQLKGKVLLFGIVRAMGRAEQQPAHRSIEKRGIARAIFSVKVNVIISSRVSDIRAAGQLGGQVLFQFGGIMSWLRRTSYPPTLQTYQLCQLFSSLLTRAQTGSEWENQIIGLEPKWV
jgi:hypothetical protein